MAYLLDANVFMAAKRLHYGFDFCPAFWGWLDEQTERGVVQSIDAVRDELLAGADELSEWARARERLFVSPDAATLPSLGAVSQWAAGQHYTAAAQSTFLQETADYYLVAEAHARGHVVVTHEVASASHKKIKIPDACLGLGVKHITPFTMLRLERARFVLSQP